MTQMRAEVIGDPIAHSKSPMIHGFWIDALGIDATYGATHVTTEGLADFIATRRNDAGWRGCNVTIPHKQAILELVADHGDLHETLGAANTVFRDEDGALAATNTDIAGFYAPLADTDLAGAHVAVIGAGGAARAVLYALARMDVAQVTILNRSPLKAAGLLALFGLKGDAVGLGEPLPPVDLLVNASPMGMVGQPPLEIDLDPLPEDALVYDIVYAPLETPLLAAARERQLETVDGLHMLIGQAALAFELFFGIAPPRDRDEELRALLTV
ncbi:shikimate dehydrogenase [Stakelama sediminis]|uniref:Shikimate dehydrogenase (NADP(+)) n=1 Tax=Stakelama sediminis TaxID=463200 RepID=A0A840Z277_9SPHN|nr:shikimate dehydrogenase [Stakelama sediminis]MBB5719816.1 shikimate dehydrogenase [Stakelama sediminis]